MVLVQELALFLTEQLNAISVEKTTDYIFDIYAEVGEYKNDGHIKGVIRSRNSNPLLIKDLISVKLDYSIEISMPVGRANKNVLNIEDIVEELIKRYNDKQHTFNSGKATFMFNYENNGQFSTINLTGDNLSMQFNLSLNFTDNGLINSSKHWLLDGVEIPSTKDVILLEKEGQTNRISEENYNKSIMLGQTKFYKFTIPFDTTSTVCTTLQADILAGNFSKTYTLSYYDGVNYTQAQPYTTTVSIFRTADDGADNGGIDIINVTFADVSATEVAPKYTIELFSTPFDNSGSNIRYFDTKRERDMYYTALEHPPAMQIKAPNLNTIFNTTQIYDYDGSIYDQNTLANMNYARIGELIDEQSQPNTYKLETGTQIRDRVTFTKGSTNVSVLMNGAEKIPIVLSGITYYVSLSEGEVHLYNGALEEIPITNNKVTLYDNYYTITKQGDYYIFSDSNNNEISRVIDNWEYQGSLYVGFGIIKVNKTNGEYYLNDNLMTKAVTRSGYIYSNLELRTAMFDTTNIGYGLFIDGNPIEAWLTPATVGETVTITDVTVGEETFESIDITFTTATELNVILTKTDTTTITVSATLNELDLVYATITLGDYSFTLNNLEYKNIQLSGGNGSTSYTAVIIPELRFTFDEETGLYSSWLVLDNDLGYRLETPTEDINVTLGMPFYIPETWNITNVVIYTTIYGILLDNITVAILETSYDYDYQFTIGEDLYYVNKEDDKFTIYYSNGTILAEDLNSGDEFTIPIGLYNYYYYQVNSASIGAKNQIILTLQMDTLTTVLCNEDSVFGDCFINKAHLNRYIDNGDGTVSFNGGIDSPLFEREDTQNVAKRLICREKLAINYSSVSNLQFEVRDAFNNWMNDNILGWIYAYYPKNTTIGSISGFPVMNYTGYGEREFINGTYIVFCVPIYKDDIHRIRIKIRRINNGNIYEETLDMKTNTLMEFLYNNNNPVATNVKFSFKPPEQLNADWYRAFNINYYTFTEGTKQIYCVELSEDVNNTEYNYILVGLPIGKFRVALATGWRNPVFTMLEAPYPNYNFVDYRIKEPLTFSKNSETPLEFVFKELTITSSLYAKEYKIFRPNVSEFKLSIKRGGTTDNYIIDNTIQTINFYSNELEMQIKESEIIFRRIFGTYTYNIVFKYDLPSIIGADKNPIFNPKLLNSDYRALSYSIDTGENFEYDLQKVNLPILKSTATETLTPDLTQNYFRISNNDGVYNAETKEDLTGLVTTSYRGIPYSISAMQQILAEQPNYFNQRIIGLAAGAGYGAVAGAISGAKTGGVGALVGAGVGLVGGILNQYFADDNIRKQANQVQNANGNTIFNLSYTEAGFYIEEYALLPSEEKIINDVMFANGYNYNRIDNIRNYLHTRKYFNTIQAQIETISGVTISNEIRNDIKQKIANGIRLWHTDDIQYEKENYELWLEEE